MLAQVYSVTHWRPRRHPLHTLGDDHTQQYIDFRFTASLFLPMQIDFGKEEIRYKWPWNFGQVDITRKRVKTSI